MKIKLIILSVVALLLMSSGDASALTYLHVVPATVTITSGEKVVRMYKDSAGTIEIELLEVGKLDWNQAWLETVYFKNIGTVSLTVRPGVEGQIEWGVVVFNPAVVTLNAGELKPIAVAVYALPDPTPGTYNFSVVFIEEGL